MHLQISPPESGRIDNGAQSAGVRIDVPLGAAAEMARASARTRVGAYLRWLRVCALTQSLVAAVILVLAVTCTVRTHSSRDNYFVFSSGCRFGVSMWLAIPVFVCACLGVGATWRGRLHSRCLLIAYFVMAIVCCLLLFVLVVTSFLWATYAFEHRQSWYAHDDDDHSRFNQARNWGISINGVLTFLALSQFVSTIIALSLICALWAQTGCCGGSEPISTATVIYVQQPVGGGGQQIVYTETRSIEDVIKNDLMMKQSS